jgi:hypothetical protein
MGAGALVGGISGGVEQCVDNALHHKPLTDGLLPAVLVGAGVGAVTSGVGALWANRARRASQATFGKAASFDYKKTFFSAHPELEGKVVVHHAVEQQTLTRYSGTVTAEEIHSLENLRGIPNELNSDIHLSKIRKAWNQFYKSIPNPTKEQLLQKATEIDQLFGKFFIPPRG